MITSDPRILVPWFRYREFTLTPVANTPLQIVGSDYSRVLLAIHVNPTGSTLWISTRSMSAVDQGFQVSPGQVPYILKYADWGAVLGSEWWAITDSLGTSLSVIDERYVPTHIGGMRQKWKYNRLRGE